MDLQRETIRLCALVDEVRGTANVEAKAKDTRLVVECDPALQVSVDPQLLISAIANLVLNAIKYSPASSTVEIRCSRMKQEAALEVRDQCGGLPEQKIHELFEPFVRGRSDVSGLGLGLTITRRAIEAHGGRVEVRNLAGDGCVFVLHVPL